MASFFGLAPTLLYVHLFPAFFWGQMEYRCVLITGVLRVWRTGSCSVSFFPCVFFVSLAFVVGMVSGCYFKHIIFDFLYKHSALWEGFQALLILNKCHNIILRQNDYRTMQDLCGIRSCRSLQPYYRFIFLENPSIQFQSVFGLFRRCKYSNLYAFFDIYRSLSRVKQLDGIFVDLFWYF